MSTVTIHDLAPALRRAEKQLVKTFEKESEIYRYATLSPRGKAADDALRLINSLVKDKRRLKKWQRVLLKNLATIAQEKSNEPMEVSSKGYRIPTYSR